MGSRTVLGPAILALAGMLATAAITLWSAQEGGVAGGPASQTLPHLLLTISCAVATALIFIFGWSARNPNPIRSVLIAALFAASGVLNLVHTLSLPGMPGAGGSGTLTSVFELTAQMLFGLALLICGIQFRAPPDTRLHRYAVLAAVAAATAAFVWSMPAFAPGLAPGTAAETRLQYAVAGIDMMALIALWRRRRREPGRVFEYLAVAALIATLGQLLAAHGGDRAHLGSHAYILLAALCACRSVYLRAIDAPYALLEEAQRALKGNYEQFRSRTELLLDWYWELDQNLRFKLLTRLVDPLSAPISEDLILGKTRWELPNLKASQEQWRAHQATLEARQPFNDFEFADDKQNEPLLFLSASGKPVFSADGMFTGYRGITRDITARKRTEILLATENRLLEMFSTGQPLDTMFATLCHETEQFVQRGSVAMLSYAENPASPRVVATPGLPDTLRHAFETIVETPESWPKGDAAHLQKPVLVRNFDDNAGTPSFNEELRDAGLMTSWTCPIVSRETTLGYLALHFPHPPLLTDHDRQFLGRITQFAAIAIERSKSDASRRLAAKALESAREGVMITDADYNVVSVNAAYTQITGYPAGEFIGRKSPTFGKGLHDPAFYLRHLDIVAREGHWTGEYWERRKNGELYYKWVSIVAVKDPDGRITHYSAVLADMTQQKEAELLLRLRHNITGALSDSRTAAEAIENSLALICKMHDWDFGACWRPVDGDKALACTACWVTPHRKLENFSQLVGAARITPGDAGLVSIQPGSSPDRLCDLARNAGYPGKAANAAGLREVLTIPVVIEGNLVAILEFRNKLPRAIEPRVVEMIHSLGNQIGTFLVRQQAERMLREREAQLRQITDNIPASILHLDRQFRIRFANRVFAEQRGLKAEDVIGRKIGEIYDLHDAPELIEYSRQAAFGKQISFRFSDRMPDGKSCTKNVTMIPECSPDGAIVGFYSLAVDITQQLRAESEILALNRELEQRVQERTQVLEAVVKELEAFSYSVSHDLRAPLRGIDGFTRLLEQRYADRLDDTGRGYLERVRRGSARMSDLIDDMLSLSQVARGGFSRAGVDLSEIARAILSDRMSLDPERRVTVDIENGIVVQGDQRLLRIAMENLLGNAWKFTARRDNALIAIGTETTPDGRAVFIRDNGAGFDMRYADKMFQSFQRLHSSLEFEGTGVGLAIVQRVINRHGGKIWADGVVGVGATIHFIV